MKVTIGHPGNPKTPEELEALRPKRMKITVGSFRRRLTLLEKVALTESPITIVKVLMDDLASSTYIDLESQELREGLQALVDLEILAVSRLPNLFQEGTEEEAWK